MISIVEKIYTQIKYLEAIIKYKSGKSSTVFLFILAPLFITGLLALRLWRFLIHVFLKITLGRSFLGFMDGNDSFHAIMDTKQSRLVVTILIMIDFKGENFEEYAKDKLDDIFNRKKLSKLKCTRERFFGYEFYRLSKKWGEFKTFAESSSEFLSEEQLQREISAFMGEEMPFGNKGMCHVLLGNKALRVKKFPIILRFHHCFGDAVTLFNLIAKEFPNNSSAPPLNNGVEQIKTFNKNQLFKKPLKCLGFFEDFKENAFSSGYLSGRKHLVWFSEEKPIYLRKIKNIKNKTNTTFMGILLTALSTSLIDFAKKVPEKSDRQLTFLLTCMLERQKFVYGIDNYECRNDFTLSLLKIPFAYNVVDIQKRLTKICNEYIDLKNKSLDNNFNKWVGTDLLNVVPSYITKHLMYLNKPNVILSNIPGCDSLVQFGDNRISDIILFDPNGKETGITLMFTTYEDRISMGFTFDKEIVPHLEDAKQILGDFLTCIDLLNDTL